MTRMSAKQYREYLEKNGKKTKYHNNKVIIDGIKYDSKKEANYHQELLILQRIGEVTKIELQPEFLLQDGFTKNGKKYQAITYKADFKVWYADGRVEIVDVKASKNFKTEVYKIKKKLFEHKYPNLTIKEVY